MKTKSIFVIIFVGLLFLLQVRISAAESSAKTQLCHSGKILGTFMSTTAPKVLHSEQNILPSNAKKNIGYAKVLLGVDQGRSLGVYDYTLVDQKGKEYPCIAIKADKGNFDAEKWCIEKSDPNTKYTLLFKVERLPGKMKLVYNFNYKFPITKAKRIPLIFRQSKSSVVAIHQPKSNTPPPTSTPAAAPTAQKQRKEPSSSKTTETHKASPTNNKKKSSNTRHKKSKKEKKEERNRTSK